MTYLQLCQAVHRSLNAGQGELAGTLPTAVTGQTGELNRIVEEVKQAWIDLQVSQARWKWRTTTGTIAAVASASSVQITTTLTTFQSLIPYTGDGDAPYILVGDETTNENQYPCYLLTWADFQGYYNRHPLSESTAAKPTYCAVRWAGAVPYLHWFPAFPSTAGGVLNLQFCSTIQTLAANADEPAMPTQYHNLIVMEAARNLAGWNENNPQFEVAERRRKAMDYALRRDQLPDIVGTEF